MSHESASELTYIFLRKHTNIRLSLNGKNRVRQNLIVLSSSSTTHRILKRSRGPEASSAGIAADKIAANKSERRQGVSGRFLCDSPLGFPQVAITTDWWKWTQGKFPKDNFLVTTAANGGNISNKVLMIGSAWWINKTRIDNKQHTFSLWPNSHGKPVGK